MAPNLTNFVSISEEYVIHLSETYGNETNTFKNSLKKAQKYKDAGLTPTFIFDKEKVLLYVTAEEILTRQIVYH